MSKILLSLHLVNLPNAFYTPTMSTAELRGSNALEDALRDASLALDSGALTVLFIVAVC